MSSWETHIALKMAWLMKRCCRGPWHRRLRLPCRPILNARRERGDEIAALDSLDRLNKSGLIYRTRDDLVFPTRAALHYTRIRV
jgi:hypothetical protein